MTRFLFIIWLNFVVVFEVHSQTLDWSTFSAYPQNSSEQIFAKEVEILLENRIGQKLERLDDTAKSRLNKSIATYSLVPEITSGPFSLDWEDYLVQGLQSLRDEVDADFGKAVSDYPTIVPTFLTAGDLDSLPNGSWASTLSGQNLDISILERRPTTDEFADILSRYLTAGNGVIPNDLPNLGASVGGCPSCMPAPGINVLGGGGAAGGGPVHIVGLSSSPWAVSIGQSGSGAECSDSDITKYFELTSVSGVYNPRNQESSEAVGFHDKCRPIIGAGQSGILGNLHSIVEKRSVLISNVLDGSTGSVIECTGVLLDSGTVLTAGHCIRSKLNPSAETGFWQFEGDFNPEAINVEMASGKRLTVRSASLIDPTGTERAIPGYHESELHHDLAIIKIGGSVNNLEPIKIRGMQDIVRENAQLFLVGRIPNSSLWTGTDRVRVLRSSSCRTLKSVESIGVILNQCMGEPGMSGSPIFSLSEDERDLHLLGVYLGNAVSVNYDALNEDVRMGLCNGPAGQPANWCSDDVLAAKYVNVGQRVDLSLL